MSSDRACEGPDLIDVLDEAVRQNEFLIGELETWARGVESLPRSHTVRSPLAGYDSSSRRAFTQNIEPPRL